MGLLNFAKKIGLVVEEDGGSKEDPLIAKALAEMSSTKEVSEDEMESFLQEDTYVPPENPPSLTPRVDSRLNARAVKEEELSQTPVFDSTDAPSESGEEVKLARSLESIYKDAGVFESSHSIEKLILMLTQLKDVDPKTRLQMIKAMDAADTSWTLEEVLLEGREKKSALQGEIQRLSSQFAKHKASAESEKAAQDLYLEEIRIEVEAQIAELQNTLDTETKSVQKAKSNIDITLKEQEAEINKAKRKLSNETNKLEIVIDSLSK